MLIRKDNKETSQLGNCVFITVSKQKLSNPKNLQWPGKTISEYILSEDVLDLVVLGEDVLVLEDGLGDVPHLVQQRQRARVTEGSPHRGQVHVVGEQQEQGCNIHCIPWMLCSLI